MPAAGPNWAEQLTAVATAVLAVGVLGAGVAALFRPLAQRMRALPDRDVLGERGRA
jgi:hypothetical protein